jgi:putative SOS response-associated peptidase YedK
MIFAALYDHVKLEGMMNLLVLVRNHFMLIIPNLADSKDAIFSCTIITTSCSKQLSFLHNRMPVIFDQNSPELEAWLDNSKPWDNSTLGNSLKPYENKLEW